MSKKKHILDWYIENTPSNEDEYEKGCLLGFAIVAGFFIILVIGIYLIVQSNWMYLKLPIIA